MSELLGEARLTRRQAVGFLGAGAAALVVAACAPATSGGTVTAPAATQPKRSRTMRMGSSTDLRNMEITTGLQANKDVMWQVSDPLIEIDRDFKPKPMLAESWEFNRDQTQLKLSLRKGATFHSGREFTSEDAKFTLTRPLDPKRDSAVGGQAFASYFIGFELPDKNTIILKMERGIPGLIEGFHSLKIADREVLAGPDKAKKVGGTGPFKFVQWTPQQSVTLVRNESWWGAGAGKRPYLDGIDGSIFGDAQAMVVALESGAIDWADIPSTRDASRLRSDPKYRLIDDSRDVTAQYHRWFVNTVTPPTDNLKVRQAIQYACDRKRILDTVMLGLGHTKYLPYPDKTLMYDAAFVNPYPFDIAKAQQLVKEADAVGSTLILVVDNGRSEAIPFSQIWADDLTKAGFKVDVQIVPAQTQDAATKSKKFNIGVSGGAGSNLETIITSMQQTFGKIAPTLTIRTPNYYRDPKLIDLVDNQLPAELDPVKRKALYRQANAIIVEQALDGAVVGRFPSALSSSKVKGASWWPEDHVKMEDVWIDE